MKSIPAQWVGNVVGKGNRHYFLAFLWLELGAIVSSSLVAIVRIHAGVRTTGVAAALPCPAATAGEPRLHPCFLGARWACLAPPPRAPVGPLGLPPSPCPNLPPPGHPPPLAHPLPAAIKMSTMESGSGAQLVWPVLFVAVDVFLLVSVAALAIAQASQVSRNVTTNELANWHRWASPACVR